MAKTKRKWIQLDPNHPDALMAQHIYVTTDKTITDKLGELEGVKTKVSVSDNDSSPDFLANKLVAGTNVTVEVLNEGAAEQIRISAVGGSGGGGDFVRDIDTYQMTPDDTATGVDTGRAFGIMDTVDFSPTQDGAVWFTTTPKANWDLSQNLQLVLYVIFSGAITEDKICKVQIDVWETQVNNVPNQIVTASAHDITVPAADTGKLFRLALDTFAISNAQSLITVKVTRLATDAGDTYDGTLQLTRANILGQLSSP